MMRKLWCQTGLTSSIQVGAHAENLETRGLRNQHGSMNASRFGHSGNTVRSIFVLFTIEEYEIAI